VVKKIGFIFLFLFGGIFIWYLISGFILSEYKPSLSNNYIWAEYHLHSNFSDGIYPPEKIAREADKVGVKLLLMTDHGDPNPISSVFKKKYGDVNIVGGSESALPEGHLNFFGAKKVPLFKLPPYPPDAIEDIREWGGFTIVTYPEDPEQGWHYWEDDLMPDGLEIINLSTYFRKLSLLGKIKAYLYLPFSRYGFLKYLKRPSFALKMWDKILKMGKVFGFYATNAHGRTPITKKIKIPEPSYSKMFSLLAIGIDKRYEGNPEIAVRKGDFFSIIRGAGEPELFEFYGKSSDGIVRQGEETKTRISLYVKLKAKGLKSRIILIKNGKIFKETEKSEIFIEKADTGIYRVEVYLKNHPLLKDNVPWIISNPIFVNYSFKKPAIKKNDFENIRKFPLSLENFHIEKNQNSKALFKKKDDFFLFKYYLSKKTKAHPDVWCSIALRKQIKTSDFDGFYIIANSDKYMRYWIELRNENGNFYSSFKLYPEKENRVLIPFTKFYRIYCKRVKEKFKQANALFISINGLNSFSNFSSSLKIKDFGFYRR